MKKLLLVLGCALLLLCVAAAPASAAMPPASGDGIWWEVFFNTGDPPWTYIIWVSDKEMVYTDGWTDDEGTFHTFTAVPAAATDLRLASGFSTVGPGGVKEWASALFERLTLDSPDETAIFACDESDCQDYYWGPYLFNSYTGMWGPLYPYNPKIGGGRGLWTMDWQVPVPQPLEVGTYTFTYSEYLAHAVTLPMIFQPGGFAPVWLVKGYERAWSPEWVYTFDVE